MTATAFKRSGVAVLILWFSAIATFGAEPTYEGKSLTRWLKLYDRANEGSSEEAEASAALRAMGSNAVPFLVQWMGNSTSDVQLVSADAFKVLKETGASAVPELAAMLNGTNKLLATVAGSALGHIGAPALPVLIAGLTNRSFRIGVDSGLALVELGTNARPAISILLADLRHPNHFYRERAADILGQLHIEADTVVPALIKLLDDDSKAARFLAITGLANFGGEARSAVPTLSRFLKDEDSGFRRTATNALRQIQKPGALK